LVLAPGSEEDLEMAERLGSRSTVARALRIFLRRRTWNEIEKFSPDVVVVQFAVAALNVNLWSARAICKRLRVRGTRVVTTFHEPGREYNILGFATRLIYRAVARVTDVPVVFSWEGRRALLETGLFKDVVEVPLGTKGVETIPDNELQAVRAMYEIHKPLVLMLGFINFDKGADIFIDAARLISDGKDNEFDFIVAGRPRKRPGIFRIMERRDMRYQRSLVAQANKLSNVTISFRDYVANENVAALLRIADVVVLPYRRIAQSGIANLALSSQSVIVCSDLPGLRSDLGEAALYVPVGDSVALAAQIEKLLGESGAAARSRLRELAAERAATSTFARAAEVILSAGLADEQN
jgi:glycosyltransferase involved in cell wall biosynthesis